MNSICIPYEYMNARKAAAHDKQSRYSIMSLGDAALRLIHTTAASSILETASSDKSSSVVIVGSAQLTTAKAMPPPARMSLVQKMMHLVA